MTAPKPKDILVTGASGVIGTAITRHLSEAGYALHLTARDLKKLAPLQSELSKKGAAVESYRLDLSKPNEPAEVIAQFFKKAANPYGLVCNAGNLGVLGQFIDLSMEEWLQGLQENFIAQARLIHAFAQEIKARKVKNCAIVALSGAGLGGNSAFNHITSYSTAKAGLTHLVEALASEWADSGMRINAVSPGQVSSGLTNAAIEAGVERAGSYALTAQKCKESGGVSPDLAARLITFLFSPEAKGINGRLLSARFDTELLEKNPAAAAQDPSLFRLRRIDNALFQPKS